MIGVATLLKVPMPRHLQRTQYLGPNPYPLKICQEGDISNQNTDWPGLTAEEGQRNIPGQGHSRGLTEGGRKPNTPA